MKKTKLKHKILTPYKDIKRRTIKVGDVIIFGFFSQHWKVRRAKRDESEWVKKGDFLMTIVSDDSGLGYEETMNDVGIDIPENETRICTAHCYN